MRVTMRSTVRTIRTSVGQRGCCDQRSKKFICMHSCERALILSVKWMQKIESAS